MPAFEYDPAKSEANASKHGIDFEAAQEIWNDGNAIEGQTPYTQEKRYYRIAAVAGKLWTAVFTYREGRIRLISVRRTRTQEAAQYRRGI